MDGRALSPIPPVRGSDAFRWEEWVWTLISHFRAGFCLQPRAHARAPTPNSRLTAVAATPIGHAPGRYSQRIR